ncbi:alpha/beta hydrolase [Zhengella sp. ZM62]|uniref:alpha/beta hydrolase n=1 Tax=Zhengella sedimenti TaxID=3390035 RepID=UPI003976045F
MSAEYLAALGLDAALLDPDSVPAETRALNAQIVERLSAAPDMWQFPPPVLRQLRLDGRGPFPICAEDTAAQTITIPGPAGAMPARLHRPSGGRSHGTYLHLHGGGWVLGSARENDARNRRLAEATGLTVISLDYRLAPEQPFPAGPDDCEAAALWLAGGGHDLPAGVLAIGGESAGAHLAVLTLMRLRDRHGLSPFVAANLNAGCYDLSGTPSVRNWGTEKLVLNTGDIDQFLARFLPEDTDRTSPSVSPLHGDLAGLPPALFTCGTRDLLLDDTLMMAARWREAGNRAQVSIWPGGCHVFQAFATGQADRSLSEIETFLTTATGAKA